MFFISSTLKSNEIQIKQCPQVFFVTRFSYHRNFKTLINKFVTFQKRHRTSVPGQRQVVRLQLPGDQIFGRGKGDQTRRHHANDLQLQFKGKERRDSGRSEVGIFGIFTVMLKQRNHYSRNNDNNTIIVTPYFSYNNSAIPWRPLV